MIECYMDCMEVWGRRDTLKLKLPSVPRVGERIVIRPRKFSPDHYGEYIVTKIDHIVHGPDDALVGIETTPGDHGFWEEM